MYGSRIHSRLMKQKRSLVFSHYSTSVPLVSRGVKKCSGKSLSCALATDNCSRQRTDCARNVVACRGKKASFTTSYFPGLNRHCLIDSPALFFVESAAVSWCANKPRVPSFIHWFICLFALFSFVQR